MKLYKCIFIISHSCETETKAIPNQDLMHCVQLGHSLQFSQDGLKHICKDDIWFHPSAVNSGCFCVKMSLDLTHPICQAMFQRQFLSSYLKLVLFFT